MSRSINLRARDIQVPGIRQFSNQLVYYPDAVNLTIGQPDFPTPEAVKEAGMRAIVANQTAYSHNAGLLQLRTAVADFFADTYDFSYDPQTEIIVTNGASEGIDSVFRTLLEEGDEVLMPGPIYSGYEPIAHLCGATCRYIDTTTTEFKVTPEALKAAITPCTKVVLLNYPSNPTGAILTKPEMDALVEEVVQHDVFVVSDEIYSENTLESQHVSFGSYPVLRDQLIVIHGLSKSHSMTGWRIGFVLGPEAIMQHVVKVHLYNSVCASLPSQYAGIEALTNCRHVPAEMNQVYVERRDYVYQRLVEMGFDVKLPQGAFYIFPSIQKYGMLSMEFATKVLHEAGVAIVPGSTFSPTGEGYVRLSYAYNMEDLVRAMDRLEAWVHANERKYA